MRRLLAFAIAISLHTHALASETAASVEVDLIRAADLGRYAHATYSAPPSGDIVVGVVLSESQRKLVVLRRQSTGAYGIDSQSQVFTNDFGPGYYIEIVQVPNPRQFSVQVNSSSGCGVQVETFRFALARGSWRVAGYDKSEPDSPATCNVNFRSREYSANLLTGSVRVVEYRSGHALRRIARTTNVPAPGLSAFNFSMFETEP